MVLSGGYQASSFQEEMHDSLRASLTVGAYISACFVYSAFVCVEVWVVAAT